MSLRHKRTKATQQDLDNHILLYKMNGIDYVPHSSEAANGISLALFNVFIFSLIRKLPAWPSGKASHS